MTEKEFRKAYEQLKGGTDNYATAGTREAWERRFIKKKYDIFVRLCDYFIDKAEFPQVSDAIKQYEYFYNKTQPYVQNVFKIPDSVMAMTKDEQKASYQELKSFLEAYPMRDLDPLAPLDDIIKAGQEYDKLIGKHGINPKEITHPSVSKRLIRDILDKLPALSGKSVEKMTSMEKRTQTMRRQEQEAENT